MDWMSWWTFHRLMFEVVKVMVGGRCPLDHRTCSPIWSLKNHRNLPASMIIFLTMMTMQYTWIQHTLKHQELADLLNMQIKTLTGNPNPQTRAVSGTEKERKLIGVWQGFLLRRYIKNWGLEAVQPPTIEYHEHHKPPKLFLNRRQSKMTLNVVLELPWQILALGGERRMITMRKGIVYPCGTTKQSNPLRRMKRRKGNQPIQRRTPNLLSRSRIPFCRAFTFALTVKGVSISLLEGVVNLKAIPQLLVRIGLPTKTTANVDREGSHLITSSRANPLGEMVPNITGSRMKMENPHWI